MAILNSRSSRRAEWLAQTRLRTSLERRVRRALGREFGRTSAAVARAYEKGGEVGAMIAAEPHAARLAAILDPHWRRTMRAFGSRMFDAVDEKAGPRILHKDDRSIFEQFIDDWVASVGAEKVVQVSQTTILNIRSAIQAGITENESNAAIAKRIREKTGGHIGRVRSEVIARTETHQASNVANARVLEMANLPDVINEWVAAEDARTRDSHMRVDGDVRPQGETFTVGSAQLLHPGDPSGPAKEVIMCRCILAAVLEDLD